MLRIFLFVYILNKYSGSHWWLFLELLDLISFNFLCDVEFNILTVRCSNFQFHSTFLFSFPFVPSLFSVNFFFFSSRRNVCRKLFRYVCRKLFRWVPFVVCVYSCLSYMFSSIIVSVQSVFQFFRNFLFFFIIEKLFLYTLLLLLILGFILFFCGILC